MSKQTFQSFNEFTAALKKDPVPYPSLESFRARIPAPKEQKTFFRKLKSVPVFALLIGLGLFLLSGATVSALYSHFVISSKDGETVIQYAQTSPEQTDKDTVTRAIQDSWSYKAQEVEDALQDGEAAYFLIAEAYEWDGIYFPLQKEKRYSSVEQMGYETSTAFIAPPAMPESYQFSQGTIRFEPEPVDTDRLYQKAKASGMPYIAEKAALTRQAQTIHLTYEADRHGYRPVIQVRIREITGNAGYTTTSGPMEGMEMIRLKNGELLYDPAFPSVLFPVKINGTRLEYEVIGNDSTTREELLFIAEGLLGAQ